MLSRLVYTGYVMAAQLIVVAYIILSAKYTHMQQ